MRSSLDCYNFQNFVKLQSIKGTHLIVSWLHPINVTFLSLFLSLSIHLSQLPNHQSDEIKSEFFSVQSPNKSMKSDFYCGISLISFHDFKSIYDVMLVGINWERIGVSHNLTSSSSWAKLPTWRKKKLKTWSAQRIWQGSIEHFERLFENIAQWFWLTRFKWIYNTHKQAPRKIIRRRWLETSSWCVIRHARSSGNANSFVVLKLATVRVRLRNYVLQFGKLLSFSRVCAIT